MKTWFHAIRSCSLVCALVLLPAAALAAAEPAFRFAFDSGPDDWRPRAASITISHITGPSATPGSVGHLRVAGSVHTGWNYTASPEQAIKPGQLYRLTAWLNVERLGSQTGPPYLKCEFVAPHARQTPGQVHTDRYDVARLGTWQRLQAEFQAPPDATACWLALEKGTNLRTEIVALLDEIVLEPVARLSVLEQYQLDPMPAEMARLRGVHPRLFLSASTIRGLREAVRTSHAVLWSGLRGHADRAVRRGPPAYRLRDSSSGDEQLWQREVGNTMPVLALAYVLTGEQQYLDSAQAWALAACGYPTWGLGRIDGMDLATGHQLFGLGIVYDWCYADLSEPARRTIRETIVRRGSGMFTAGATGKAWWGRSYLQNHLWVNVCGLAIAGLAVYDEVEDATLWIGFGLDKIRHSVNALGPDGASHEGVGYWEYGVEYLLKFMHVAHQLLGVDLYEHPWWRATARYSLYLGLPRNAWTSRNCIVDIADCPRSHWYGPDYLLRGLARQFRDPYAQWLAQEIDQANVAASGAPWLNLVWYDPSISATPPTDLPTMHHFPDMDIVSARSDWSGDESLVVFKCGPFLGHRAMQEFSYDPGGGHVHPDANHFVLFGAGDWLVRDDGYRAKWTGQHNTLLIDGQGQLGEGQQWFSGSRPLAVQARPRILLAESTPLRDHLVGDATEAYAREFGLQHFRRHLLFCKPDVLIIADDIRLREPRSLELRFHPEQQQGQLVDGAYHFSGNASVLRMEPLTRRDVQIDAGALAAEGRHGEGEQTMYTVRLRCTTDHWRNVVALSWAPAGTEPRRVSIKVSGDVATFHVGSQEIPLDWATPDNPATSSTQN